MYKELTIKNIKTYYLKYFGGNGSESLKRISINDSNTRTAVLTIPMEDFPSYFSLSICEGDSTNKNIQIEYNPSKIVS
jgi:hypothetical protein